jgi:Fe-S-cluster containining protein
VAFLVYMENQEGLNICQKYGCSECCNPVKVKEGFGERHKESLNGFPFRKRDEIWTPHESVDGIKLEVYDCENYDKEKGVCTDYENRPEVCRNTTCDAHQMTDEAEQKKIIESIKGEEFVICKK